MAEALSKAIRNTIPACSTRVHQQFSRAQTDLEKSIGKRQVYRPSDWSMTVPEHYPHAAGNGGTILQAEFHEASKIYSSCLSS